MIDYPHSIVVYNNYMGGVDKIEYLISLYNQSKTKSKKKPGSGLSVCFSISEIWQLPVLGWSIVILSLNMYIKVKSSRFIGFPK